MSTLQGTFKTPAALRSWGRNGFFGAAGFNIHKRDKEVWGEEAIQIDIEGKRSIKGARAPISVTLSPEDAAMLAGEIVKAIGEASPANDLLTEVLTLVPASFSPVQIEAIVWAVDYAVKEQEQYLREGDFEVDYGDEWPETANLKADQVDECASVMVALGQKHLAETCASLATAYRKSAEGEDFVCAGCGRDETVCSENPCPDVIADRET